MKRWILYPLVSLALGCGITGQGPEGDGDQVDDAWQLYRQQRFEESAQRFQDLALQDVAMAESYCGLGWSHLRLLDPSAARSAFQSSLLDDPQWTDSRAGEVFALRDAGGSADVLLSRARSLLRDAPTWRFSHEASVDWRDLQILMAQVFFYTQRFDSCLARCRIVDDAMALSRVDTLSWLGSPTFENALLSELERLTQEVAE